MAHRSRRLTPFHRRIRASNSAYQARTVSRLHHTSRGLPVVPLVCSWNMCRVSQSSATNARGWARRTSLVRTGQSAERFRRSRSALASPRLPVITVIRNARRRANENPAEPFPLPGAPLVGTPRLALDGLIGQTVGLRPIPPPAQLVAACRGSHGCAKASEVHGTGRAIGSWRGQLSIFRRKAPLQPSPGG